MAVQVHSVPPVVTKAKTDRPPTRNKRIIHSYSIRNARSQDRLFKWVDEAIKQTNQETSEPIGSSRGGINTQARQGWRSKSYDGAYIQAKTNTGSNTSATGYKLDVQNPNKSCDVELCQLQSRDGQSRSLDRNSQRTLDTRGTVDFTNRSRSLERVDEVNTDEGLALKGKRLTFYEALMKSSSNPTLNPQKWNKPRTYEPPSTTTPRQVEPPSMAFLSTNSLHPSHPPREYKPTVHRPQADPLDGLVVEGSCLGQLGVFSEWECKDTPMVKMAAMPGVMEEQTTQKKKKRAFLQTRTDLSDPRYRGHRACKEESDDMKLLVNLDANHHYAESHASSDADESRREKPAKKSMLTRFRIWKKEQTERLKNLHKRRTPLQSFEQPEVGADALVVHAVDNGSVDAVTFGMTNHGTTADDEFLLYRVRMQQEGVAPKTVPHGLAQKKAKKFTLKVKPVVKGSTFVLSDMLKRKSDAKYINIVRNTEEYANWKGTK